MAISYRTCGFVIRKADIGEADRVFTIFTQDFGKIKVLGKAIRKLASKFRGGLDMNCFSETEFIQGKTLKTLTDAVVIERFANIKKSSWRLKISNIIGKYADDFLAKEEKDQSVISLLKATYSRLNSLQLDEGQIKMVYFYFIWNLFAVLGYKPELYKCIVCQKKIVSGLIYFSSADGGVICKSCIQNKEGVKTANSDTIEVLRLILKRSWNTLSKLKVLPFSQKLLRDISNNYYLHLLSIHSSDFDIIKDRKT